MNFSDNMIVSTGHCYILTKMSSSEKHIQTHSSYLGNFPFEMLIHQHNWFFFLPFFPVLSLSLGLLNQLTISVSTFSSIVLLDLFGWNMCLFIHSCKCFRFYFTFAFRIDRIDSAKRKLMQFEEHIDWRFLCWILFLKDRRRKLASILQRALFGAWLHIGNWNLSGKKDFKKKQEWKLIWAVWR